MALRERLGIEPNKIEPPAPIDKNIYELPPEEYGAIKMVPTSLYNVLDTLEDPFRRAPARPILGNRARESLGLSAL